MKYLVIGLGNPGAEYENTRHNIGFKVLDKLASLSNISFSTDRYADVAEVKFKGRHLVLIKPNTFMNLSGKAVNYWLQKEKINKDNLLIITDDIALTSGELRMRAKGSDGGHNGLKDINKILGITNYARLRFGVGNDFSRGNQVQYVLSDWNKDEEKKLEISIDQAISMIKAFCTIGIDRTMSMYNGK